MSAVQATGAEVHNAASAAGTPEAELAHKCLYYMLLMREVEDRIERKLYRQGKVVGGVYVGRGQEAIPVGSALVSQPDDVLLSVRTATWPCSSSAACSARRVFAQYMGRMGGLTRGRDGNMHMGDLSAEHRLDHQRAGRHCAGGRPAPRWPCATRASTASPSATSATAPPAAATGTKASTSPAVQKLPVVFICNNNQYAYSTPLNLQMACANVADRGPAYGMPAEIVDGNDVLAVYEATQRAAAHARAGKGPYLLECKTFRMTGHSAHDAAHYVPKGLFEEWGKLDPIVRLEKRMLDEGWADAGGDRRSARRRHARSG